MRATVLVDNLPARGLEAEWGLAIYIEYEGHTILLDAGGSGLFAQNAAALGLDLAQVEFGVLSHAHWDHADGMDTFFAQNKTAPFYLRQGCGETCYDKKEDGWKYEGIKKGLLAAYAHRIRYVDGDFSPLPGVTLLPHRTPGLAEKGLAENMFRKTPAGWVPDDFSHEQSLVFDTQQGLVIFNSCCHAGADVIVREAAAAFPGRPIHAIVGGFHLYETPAEEVRAFAHRLQATGLAHVVTGHCTGQPAYDILQEVLGDKILQLSTGLVLDLSQDHAKNHP